MSSAITGEAGRPLVDAAVRKIFLRLMPVLIVIYILAYIDRVNIGVAALSMNADLGLTATMFGFAGTIFFVAYALFEVPSNLMLARMGIRLWISRIMVTWGLASAACMFAVGPYSLYALRALVGLAEAGLYPGILYFLGRWVPARHRAKSNAIFLASTPLALSIGSPVSAAILGMDGIWGLQGWQWVFLLEGLPTVAVGVAVYFLLVERPAAARWLSDAEKDALHAELPDEAPTSAPAPAHHSVLKELMTPKVLALAVTFFAILTSQSTLGIWIPQIVNELYGSKQSYLVVGFTAAIPPFLAVFAMQLWARRSDKAGERTWHTVAALLLSGAGWCLAGFAGDPVIKMIGLCLAAMGVFSASACFWTSVMEILSRKSQAVGVPLIGSCGTTASVVTPLLVGILRDATHSFSVGMWYTGFVMVAGAATIASTAPRRPR